MVSSNRDPCGIVWALSTYIWVFFADYAFCFHVISEWSGLTQLAHIVCYNFIVCMALWSHAWCMLSDPGFVPIGAEDAADGKAAESDDATSTAVPSRLPSDEAPGKGGSVELVTTSASLATSPEYPLPPSETNESKHLLAKEELPPIPSRQFPTTSPQMFAQTKQDVSTHRSEGSSLLTRNPGTSQLSHSVPISDDEPTDKRMHCQKCLCVKPMRAYHCRICKRCVIRMDHHCPWVNNCVGAVNQKQFNLFLLYTNLMCAYMLVGLALRVKDCVSVARQPLAAQSVSELANRGNFRRAFLRPSIGDDYVAPLPLCTLSVPTTVSLSIAFFEAVLFGMFTTIIWCDQGISIYRNATGVEQVKGLAGPPRDCVTGLRQTFGSSVWLW